MYIKNADKMKLKTNPRNINTTACLIQSLLLSCSLVFLISCSQNINQKTNEKKTLDPLTYPRTTVLSNLSEKNKPKEIFLENTPKPISISIPEGSGNTDEAPKSGKSSTRLLPPVKHSFINSITNLPIAADAQGNGFFTKYSTDDGLALDQIYCSYKDKNGYLWFGTNGGGVSKYDGRSFTNYTTAQGLANNIVWSIMEDKNGNLWFGTDGSGLSKYDGKRFTNYSTVQGLSNNVVRCIMEDSKGNLWFGTEGSGVNKFDGKDFTNYTTTQGLASNVVRSIIEDSAGNIWFGTYQGGVSKYDGNTFTNYTTDQGLAGNDVRCIIEDKKDNLWFGTNGGGISKYDGKSFTNYTTAQGFANNAVFSIKEDRTGNIWFGTDGGGISKYDGENFTNYTTAQGLVNNAVYSITEDETGNLWFGTFGGGIGKYAGNSFTNYTTAQGLANNVVYSIVEDQIGNLWFGTLGNGVSKYDGRSFTNYARSQGITNDVIYCIAKDKTGSLWFGTSGGGVIKYDGKKFTNYTTAQGLANNAVFSILEDKTGNLWFATSGGGVSKFNGKSFINYTTEQGLANNVVYSITEDGSGNVWFGTSGGGVSKFDGKSFINFSTIQGLADDVVWTIKEDKSGNLWFGTQEGLSLLRPKALVQFSEAIKNKEPFYGPLFETFTTKDGLPDNYVTQVVPDDNSLLYIGTNLGICELMPGNSTNTADKKWTVGKVYNSTTGYPVKDVNIGPGAMYKDSKGIIWIATGSDKTALVRFDPRAIINQDMKPPTVVIQRVKINNENITWNDLTANAANEKIDSNSTAPNIIEEIYDFKRPLSDIERDSMRRKFTKVSFDGISKWYAIPEKLVLSHQDNNISFEFNAIETGRNFLVKYQYMLEGYDKGWSPPDTKASASFGNIFEGTYTFKLKAQSPDGVWSEPVTYTFEVLPPWWRTWWMYTVYLILTIIFILLFVRWNSRRIIHQKNILEQKITIATKQIREEKETVEVQKKKIEDTLKDLEAAQAQLIQSEKMASLGELTAGIAHEIQNPLNFVNNFSEVSNELIDEMNGELDKGAITEAKVIAADLKQNLERINHHGKRADAIVKSMLEHSSSGSGKKEPTDINALSAEYLRLASNFFSAKNNWSNITTQTYFNTDIEKQNIIPQEIGRVLLNLYNNAFYAVNEKKQQNIAGYEPTVSVSTNKSETHIYISVKDNGKGIPQKIVDKIFQPFFTTKPTGQGTGLGLSLSYDIIKAQGGEIKVETKEGEGTTFIIQLPVKASL